ncbi:hypothetical protein [Micromonospora sp. NPDC049679]|uniref:hypothetical protein n=1 Tax=Micromonospora sp. NPDC049679 TaxID=3155920 RepID=UPI0033ECF015
MPDPQPNDHTAVVQHVRTTLPYRLAVWYLRLALVTLPVAFIDFWVLGPPIWGTVIVLGWICFSPVR